MANFELICFYCMIVLISNRWFSDKKWGVIPMEDLIWPLVWLIIGLAMVLQWGKSRTARLAIRKVEAEHKFGKVTQALEIESRKTANAELERREREFELTMRDTPEGRALVASELALKAAQNRQTAAQMALVDDPEILAARKQALIDAAERWAKEQPAPQPPKDPIESLDLTKAYTAYCKTGDSIGFVPLPMGEWLGKNYAHILNRA